MMPRHQNSQLFNSDNSAKLVISSIQKKQLVDYFQFLTSFSSVDMAWGSF